jgi:hypothetical protein
MRETWTDARLDDFAKRTDQRFDGVDRRFDALERRMESGFKEMNARFDALQRLLLRLGGVVIAALIGLIATQL